MTKQEMTKILEENKDLIENNDFQEFYYNLDSLDRPYFTDLFLKSGINPLKYMQYIPERFAFNLSIKEIEIPDNITAIESNAFTECDQLKDVYLPDFIERIDPDAFVDCIGLETINIPDYLDTLPSSCFYGCKNLKEIVIGSAVTYIDSYCFYGCYNLLNIYYNGTVDDWKHIEIEELGNMILRNSLIHCLDEDE